MGINTIQSQLEALLPDLYEASLTELQRGLEDGRFTSVHLVKAYLARIDEVNLKGPALRAVIETNPFALTHANNLDLERRMRGPRGPLHGIPIILKDNIVTRQEDGMNTTAGSYALMASVAPRASFVVDRLCDAGAIILGKSTMTEWAGMRGGSSSGSAIATAIGLAAAALGTETNGSIIIPACRQNVVGLKPTVGLTSRSGVIPVSEHQDSVGVHGRSVTDVATVLSIIAGKDPRDKYTLKQPDTVPNYPRELNEMALRGVRLGVPRVLFQIAKTAPEIITQFNQALDVLKILGAVIVDPVEYPAAEEINEGASEELATDKEFKDSLERYLADLVRVPSGTRTLADVIAFNFEHAELELPSGYDDQDRLISINSFPGFNEAYYRARARCGWLGTEGSIDYAIRTYNLDALVLPTGKNTTPSALAGYPIISVPLGFFPEKTLPVLDGHTFYPAPGIPFGIAFTGSAYTESKLLNYAYAFEKHTKTRLTRKAYPEAIPKTQLTHVM